MSSNKKILFFDTSTDKILVAVYIGDKLCRVKRIFGSGDLSETLLPLIDQILTASSLTISDLDLLAVNPGPGSYTGLRIGIAVANAISWSLKIPLVQAKILGDELKFIAKEQVSPIFPQYSHPPKITQPKKTE